MSINLTTEQRASQQAWLPSLKQGDPVLISYDKSEEGQVPATIVDNDGAWITVLPDGLDDDATNWSMFCAVSGNGAYYGAIVPMEMRQDLLVETETHRG